MKIKIVELRKLMQKILTQKHFSASQVRDIMEVLLYAELSGKNTQGIIKFLGNEPIQDIIPEYEPKIIKNTNLSVLVDGGRNPGILVSVMAVKLAIKKCKKNGFALIGTNNAYSSTGALGYYANEIAKNDLIGIVMSGTPKGVAPYGSIDKLFGINPIAFGFPTENDPLIFDMATAAITWYGLVRAKMMGKKLPEGVAIDKEGKLTRDPKAAMEGAILTFGKNHKGSGLSMMIEMFTGPLVGSISPDSEGKWYNGSLFIAIDPDLLMGKKYLKKNSSLLINRLKKSRTSKNFQEVIMPGEKALRSRREAEASGVVEVDDKMYNDFLTLTS